MAQRIQFRRDTAANWTATNPILAQGELGLEIDTNFFKIGDGATAWNSLGYGVADGQARRKQYVVGTAYTNGTPTVTCPNAGFTVVRGLLIPYQTSDGAWRLIFQIAFTQDATGTDPVLTLSGITSKNISNWYQTGVGVFGDTPWTDVAGQSRNGFYATPNTNTIRGVVSSAFTRNGSGFIDFELEGKPTWAD